MAADLAPQQPETISPRSSSRICRFVLILAAPFLCAAAYYFGTFAADGVSKTESSYRGMTIDGLLVEANFLVLGEIWEAPDHRVNLTIKNVSNETRTIKEFARSCDCTA